MTPAEKKRIYVCKHAIGCLPCLLDGWLDRHSDYHHVTDGESRLGHMFGFPMCLWHHRGKLQWKDPPTPEAAKKMMGPSFELHSKDFAARYGSQTQLVQLADEAVRVYTDRPWNDHEITLEIAAHLRDYHKKLVAELPF